jgi:hypothetical protein
MVVRVALGGLQVGLTGLEGVEAVWLLQDLVRLVVIRVVGRHQLELEPSSAVEEEAQGGLTAGPQFMEAVGVRVGVTHRPLAELLYLGAAGGLRRLRRPPERTERNLAAAAAAAGPKPRGRAFLEDRVVLVQRVRSACLFSRSKLDVRDVLLSRDHDSEHRWFYRFSRHYQRSRGAISQCPNIHEFRNLDEKYTV